jgi:hypothetical protein
VGISENPHVKTIGTDQVNNKISNKEEINKNDSQNVKDKKGPTPTIYPSRPSQPSHIHRLGRSDVFQCDDCNQRGDKWFMEKHNCRAQKQQGNGKGEGKSKTKSKATQAAADNLAGNGVLDTHSEE